MPEAIRNNVFFVGLKDLDSFDQKRVKDIVYSEFEKITREFKDINSLRVHFKKYEEGGAKSKFSVHLLIDGPSKPIAIDTQTSDWDAIKVLHKVFDKAKTHLAHKFKGNTTHPVRISKEKKIRMQ